jgi:hypothetical protein
MDQGLTETNGLTDLKEQELRFFAKWSLIAGITTFCTLVIYIALGIIVTLLSNSGPSLFWWTESYFLELTTRLLTLTSAIIAIIFSVLGRRRLAPDSERGIRRKLRAGLIMGIIFLTLVLLGAVYTTIFYYQHFNLFD